MLQILDQIESITSLIQNFQNQVISFFIIIPKTNVQIFQNQAL